MDSGAINETIPDRKERVINSMFLLVKIAILKTFRWKTVLLISNQLFTDDSLMIHFYFFEQRIMLKSLRIISNNINT